MATTDDPVEVIASLIGTNWNRKIKFRKLIPKIYTHWINQKDSMPAITVWKIFSPVQTRHLTGKHLLKRERYKIILRSKDKQDLHIMEEEVERIIVQNNTDLSTSKYTNPGVQFIQIINTLDLRDGLFHRRDLDIQLLKQRVYD